MQQILSAILGSMHADMARMDRVAMNVSNAQTPGYKREVDPQASFASRIEADQADAAPRMDIRPGVLRTTGLPLDVALVGDGWFEVSTPHGAAYTRQGNFRLDARGRLVTQQGDPVMGTNGEIQLLHGAPVIDAAGRVFDAGLPASSLGTPVGQLQVWRWDFGALPRRLGNGLMAMPEERLPASGGTVQVLQGHLEASNVNPMQEMVRLLETVRHMETLQRVALGYDEMLGTSIRRLGET